MNLDHNTLWVVVGPIGSIPHYVMHWTLAQTRRDSISQILQTPNQKTWRQLYREGHRCVRVDVIPHTGKAGG